MKMRAAREGRKLRDVATEVVRRGLSQQQKTGSAKGTRVEFPIVKCKPAAPGTELDPSQIADLLVGQEAQWNHDDTRH